MTTRPLNPTYAAILAQLVDGPLSRAALGCTVGQINALVYLRWIESEPDPTMARVRGGHPRRFHLTALGRSVLAAGVVAARKPGPKAKGPMLPLVAASSTPAGNVNPRFTSTMPPRREPVARTEHAHHWIITGSPVQTWTCQTCPATKEFRPTFGRELVTVGGGRVKASERWAS